MAQKLKFGNGTWATKEGSTLAYNDENNNYKPLPFTTTRDSIATRVNKEGLIEVVGNDIPRIDYTDSADGVLLLENSATNLVTHSEDASQWLNVNEIITKDEIISPDGTLSADKFEFTGNGSIRPNTSQLTFIDNYVFSVFIKKGNSRYVTLQARFFTTSSTIGFDLDNATAESGGVIENYGNDWFRLSLTNNVTGDADRTGVFYVYLPNELGSMTSVSGNYAYVWGAQISEGSYVTSYIPTNGSTATRLADTASGSGNSEVFNDSEGVLFADIAALANDVTSRRVAISDGTYSNRIYFEYDETANRVYFVINSGGVNQVNIQYDANNLTLFNKLLVKYKANDFSVFFNGFKIGTDLSGSTPSGLKELAFDDGGNTSKFYGKTKEIGYYDTALTDEELEVLTSYETLTELVTELNLNEL